MVSQGQDAKHTFDLPAGNRTTDQALAQLADVEQRILISKDQDFLNSFLLNDSPQRLLRVSTGNISNQQLLQEFETHLPDLLTLFEQHRCIELNASGLILHN